VKKTHKLSHTVIKLCGTVLCWSCYMLRTGLAIARSASPQVSC